MKVSQSQPQSSSSRQLQSVCSQLSDSLQQQKEKIFELEAKLRQKSRSQYQQDSSTQICLQVNGLVRDLAGDRAGEELGGQLIISIRPAFYFFFSENTSHQ